jgi:hypothetical protein
LRGSVVLQYGSPKGNPPMNITDRSSKPEIISAALELTDHQAATIERLQQQQRILWATLAALTVWALL